MRMRDPSRTWYRNRKPEDGQALVVVLSVMLVVVLLSVALLVRVNGDLDNTNLETKIQQARALAQSGVADALFQIDQQGASPSSFCNEPNSGGKCTLSSIPGAHGAVYTARYDVSTDAYTVLSRGTVRNVSYAVQATVKNTPILQDAVYGGAFVSFNGKSTSSVVVTDAYGNPVPGATAGIAVGPGGTLTCNGPPDNPPDGQVVEYINYGGSISKCTPYESLGPVYEPEQPSQTCPPPINPYGAPPTPCLPSTASPCTSMSPAVSGSDAAGYTVTGAATLEPGVYVCRGGLTMTGTVTIDYAQNPQQNGGRVEIYVFPPVGSMTSPNVSFGGSTVNACETVGSGSGTCKGGLVGDPTDLQIYAWGSGTAGLGASQVNAVFWGPGMSLTLNGASSSLTWTGGLILGGVTANGAPSFNLNFDQRLENEYQQSSWQISNYLQTSPNFSLP
jgi:Tfp pilus assembly protein PilX